MPRSSRRRQPDGHGGALAGSALDAQVPPVQAHQRLHQGQAQAGAAVRQGVAAGNLLERLHQPWDVSLRDADPGIAHYQLQATLREAQPQVHLAAGRRELHGIGQQVQQDLPERPRIRPAWGRVFREVERKADRALLGFCGLKRVNSEGAPYPGDFEVGWRLREDAWGQGYAKEAAIESLDLAFDRYGAPHVVALTVVANAASQGLMKRLGMVRREDLDFASADVPAGEKVIVYRIDAADWPAARAAALA